jgi:transposase
MTKGLSIDLRKRAVAYYEAHRGQGATYELAAARFAIGKATLNRWLRLKRETGSVAVKPRKPVQRSPIDMDWLKAHVEAHPDATLKQRAQAHQQERGGRVLVISSFSGALKRLGFTHKKRPSTPRSGNWSASPR